MKILELVPRWVLAALVAVMVVIGFVQTLTISDLRVSLADNKVVSEALRADIEKLQADAAKQRAIDEAAARKRERELVQFYDQQEKAKDEQIDRLRADVRNLRSGLQHLPARPSATGQDVGARDQAAAAQATAQQCDKPVLYREDGSLLVDEAERAETIRLELLRVYELYDKAREVTEQP